MFLRLSSFLIEKGGAWGRQWRVEQSQPQMQRCHQEQQTDDNICPQDNELLPSALPCAQQPWPLQDPNSDPIVHVPHSCLCAICLNPMVNAVSLSPCRHSLCRGCSVTLHRLAADRQRCSTPPVCPICRHSVTKVRSDVTVSNIVAEILGPNVANNLVPFVCKVVPAALEQQQPQEQQPVTPTVAPTLATIDELVAQYEGLCSPDVTAAELRRVIAASVESGHDSDRLLDCILALTHVPDPEESDDEEEELDEHEEESDEDEEEEAVVYSSTNEGSEDEWELSPPNRLRALASNV